MEIHSAMDKIAAYLAASAEFREHGYTVVSGVRVKDVLLNGASLQGNQTVDLLICDGSRVLTGIAYRPETAKLFNLNMRGLSYVQVPEIDTELPLFPEDDGWLDFPSEACLESLLKSVLVSVSCVRYRQGRRSLASYRNQAGRAEKLEGKWYTLPAVPPEQLVDRRSRNALSFYKKMAAKQLLRGDFTPTLYGSAHGLFLRYQADPFGDVSAELLTVPGAVEDIRAVLSWHPEQRERTRRISLAKRIHDLPVTGECTALSAVRTLLNTPVDVLFQNRTEDLRWLLGAMSYGDLLLNGKEPTGDPDPMPVYWEVLQTIHSLRQGFSDDPLLDDERSFRMRRTCEKLLLRLAEAFLAPRNTDDAIPQDKVFVKQQPLRARLADAHSQSVFPIFGIPLASYYQAVSRLSECEYPNWVYRTRIRPIFEHTQKPEESYNLRFLAAYCKICQEDNGDHDWNETFPLLLDLIMMPVCIKHL